MDSDAGRNRRPTHILERPTGSRPQSSRWDSLYQQLQSDFGHQSRHPLVSTRQPLDSTSRSSPADDPGLGNSLPAVSSSPHPQVPLPASGLNSSRIPDFKVPERRVDIVCDPSQASRDLTIRLELEVEADWDSELEGFCRLWRLGRFKEAKQHFKAQLQHLSTIPYLWVEYANMLLSAGDYKSFQEMPDLPELWYPGPKGGPLENERWVLKANYDFLRLMERSPSHRLIQSVEDIVGRIIDFQRWSSFNTCPTTVRLPFSREGYHYPKGSQRPCIMSTGC